MEEWNGGFRPASPVNFKINSDRQVPHFYLPSKHGINTAWDPPVRFLSADCLSAWQQFLLRQRGGKTGMCNVHPLVSSPPWTQSLRWASDLSLGTRACRTEDLRMIGQDHFTQAFKNLWGHRGTRVWIGQQKKKKKKFRHFSQMEGSTAFSASRKCFDTVVNVWEISQAEKPGSSPAQARISAPANQIVARSWRLLNVAKYSGR